MGFRRFRRIVGGIWSGCMMLILIRRIRVMRVMVGLLVVRGILMRGFLGLICVRRWR